MKERTTSRRAASKAIKYNFDENSSDSDKEQVLYENEAVKEESPTKTADIAMSSDSDTPAAPPPRQETSENMFDSLLGN